MRNGYYSGGTYHMSRRQHRRILRRRIRSACNITIGICLMMMVGIMGSAEFNEVSIAEFFIYQAVNLGVLLLSVSVRLSV